MNGPTNPDWVKAHEAIRTGPAAWPYKAIEFTKGNQTHLGCVVLAILGKAASNPPKITGHATVTKDGLVTAGFTGHDGLHTENCVICHIDDLTEKFSWLADMTKLDDSDRIAMYAAVRNWIAKDLREGDNKRLQFSQGRWI